jgi:hypothetical protein
MRFDNMRDAEMRLVGTILFYDNRAFSVRAIDEDLRLVGNIILTGEDKVVEQTDELLKFHCPPLGYVNLAEDSLYFMRQPMRRWKQGVDMRALVCPSHGLRARGRIDPESLAKCMEGDYPSFERALGMFNCRNPFKQHERRGVAFSKHFAVTDLGQSLCYKGKPVGVVENGVPLLSERHRYLTESLEAEI